MQCLIRIFTICYENKIGAEFFKPLKHPSQPKSTGCEVIKLEFNLKLKIKSYDWLFADTCPQEANRCCIFELETVLKFYSLGACFLSAEFVNSVDRSHLFHSIFRCNFTGALWVK